MLSDWQIKKISEKVLRETGIVITEDRSSVLKNKFYKFLKAKSNLDVSTCFSLILENDEIFREFLDYLTINHTLFFREQIHFFDLAERVKLKGQKKVKIWSAACSIGAEPYTICMVLEDLKANYKILATDIDRSALETAKSAKYPLNMLDQIPKTYRKYVNIYDDHFEINQVLKEKVIFETINLIHIPDNLKPELDAIFCRNVFIYFNFEQKIACLEHLKELLLPGGVIYLGLSEFIPSHIPGLKFIGKSIYIKEA